MLKRRSIYARFLRSASGSSQGSSSQNKLRRPLKRSIEDVDYHSRHRQKTLVERMVRLVEGPQQPGTLILVRHGESHWNQQKLFTGWCDVDLSDRGV